LKTQVKIQPGALERNKCEEEVDKERALVILKRVSFKNETLQMEANSESMWKHCP
jgi:hypothetical protein